MKKIDSKHLVMAGVLGLACLTQAALPGLRMVGRFLYTPTGEKIVLRGINEETVWLGKTGLPAFPEIAKTKANVIRISWDKSGTAAELDVAIINCVKNGMIPMPELHDATGNWSGLPGLVDRWTSPEFVKVIQKHEKYLMVNIGNEVGQTVSDADYKAGYNLAVQRMRRAGIRVPLVIDASGYGQNYEAISKNAPDIMAKDSLKNVMFSVHMYWPLKWNGNSKAAVEKKVRDALDDAVAKSIPLIVGEFAEAFTDAGVVAPGDSIPFRTIMAECNKREIGWIPWSWRGNKPQTDLDMSPDGTYKGLKLWGLEAMVTDPNSVANSTPPIKYIVDGLASGAFPSTKIAPPSDSVALIGSVIGNGKVSITPNRTPVEKGAMVMFAAIPADGWIFSHWTGSSTSTDDRISLPAEDDLSVTAVFLPAASSKVHAGKQNGGGLSVQRRSHGLVVSCGGRSCGDMSFASIDGSVRALRPDASGAVVLPDVEAGLYLLKADGFATTRIIVDR